MLPYFWNPSMSSWIVGKLDGICFVDRGPIREHLNGPKMASSWRCFQRHSARVCLCMLYVLVPSAEGETEVLNTQRSAVSPLTPFCKHCFAVEHENKIKKTTQKTNKQKYTVVFFLCFYFGDFYWWLFPRVCGSALWIDGKHRQNSKSAFFSISHWIWALMFKLGSYFL